MSVEMGFSYVGLLFLGMLIVPNAIWSKNKPTDYDKYVKNENRLFVLLERTGEVFVTCFALIFRDFNLKPLSGRTVFLLLAFAAMVLYEIYWARYFRSEKTMADMYSSLMGVPVAGATLPVIAFLLLGMYGQNLLLILATALLGIGHIGIHLGHKKEIS